MNINCTPLMDGYITMLSICAAVFTAVQIQRLQPQLDLVSYLTIFPSFPRQLPSLASWINVRYIFFPENQLFHRIFKFIGIKLILVFFSNYFTFLCHFNFVSFLNPNGDLNQLPFFLDQICQSFVFSENEQICYLTVFYFIKFLLLSLIILYFYFLWIQKL